MENKTEDGLIVIGQDSRSLTNPQQIMDFGKILSKYITENKLSVKIKGNDYAMVDGWKFAGANFGIVAIPKPPVRASARDQLIHVVYAKKSVTRGGRSWEEEIPIYASTIWNEELILELKKRNKLSREIHKEFFAFDCSCDLVEVKTGKIVGGGHATCTNLELTKVGFDEYAIKSMGETRAIGKAFRNLIGYVMQAAGIESTPAEEMDEISKTETILKEVKKPKLDNEKFDKAIPLLKEQKLTVEAVTEAFSVTEDQLIAMTNAFAGTEVVSKKKPHKKASKKKK